MSRTLVQDVVCLTREGWRPYNDQPERAVYERLGCEVILRGKRKPIWFVRGDVFLCLGCASRCSLTRPAGFPLPLPFPLRYTQPKVPYALTPDEMVTRKNLLTVREASYCLNVSERQVYNWLAEGRLVALKERPIRVRAAEVKAMMRNFDE